MSSILKYYHNHKHVWLTTSALFYIDDLSEIMDEVITKIEANKDEKNELDVANILYEFALEAIGIAYKFTLIGIRSPCE